MADVTVKKVEEIEAYSGPKAIPGIRIRGVGRTMGVSAWGMNVIELDPGATGYPEHDHKSDGQEEIYLVLRGSATLKAGGSEWQVTAGSVVRVGPAERRKFISGADGLALVAIGGTPGKAYVPRK